MKAKFATKRIVLLVLAAVMLTTAVVGGTLAWIKTSTNPIQNTFSIGNVTLELTETYGELTSNSSATTQKRTFQIQPGIDIAKDPVITVGAHSYACYLYVKIEETEDVADYINYEVITDANDMGDATVADVYQATSSNLTKITSTYYGTAGKNQGAAWTQLKDDNGQDVEGVYYIVIDRYITDPEEYYILKNNIVSTTNYKHPPKYTQSDNNNAADFPALTFTAYAIQMSGWADSTDATISANPIYYAWLKVSNN